MSWTASTDLLHELISIIVAGREEIGPSLSAQCGGRHIERVEHSALGALDTRMRWETAGISQGDEIRAFLSRAQPKTQVVLYTGHKDKVTCVASLGADG